MNRFVRWALVLTVCLLPLAGSSAHAAPGASLPRARPASRVVSSSLRFARDYRLMRSSTWRSNFPNLRDNFQVLGPSTDPKKKSGYNCIAHTVRTYSGWVWPGTRVGDFDRLYRRHGYRRVRGLNYRAHPRLEKIVLYARRQRGRWVCTHGALQLRDGTWSSKLGSGPLIRHDSPNALTGPSYGRPIAVYVRLRR
jgi:hypothetical protein